MIPTLVVLGATGDLARRFLFPALGALLAAGELPEGFRVVGAARNELDDEEVRRLAGDDFPAELLTYRPVDLADPSSIQRLLEGLPDGPVAFYLALPPSTFPSTIETLTKVGPPPDSRVVVEKPFGEDEKSAAAINTLLAPLDAYRVDHALGMETVRNLIAIRRANPFLDEIWNGDCVEQAQVLWEETLALEGRAGFYDQTGALKDVLQNHMLQVLAVAAMDPTGGSQVQGAHHSKLEVLKSTRATPESRRARYTAGTLADGRDVPDYAAEEGVDPSRETETFAEVVLELDTSRWGGTRWVLRAGKALAGRRKLVLFQFRDGGEMEIGIDGPNDLVLRLARERNDHVALRAPAPTDPLPAYARVLLDILNGTSEHSVGAAEAEESWRVVAPILAAWEAGRVPLEEYPAGSHGP